MSKLENEEELKELLEEAGALGAQVVQISLEELPDSSEFAAVAIVLRELAKNPHRVLSRKTPPDLLQNAVDTFNKVAGFLDMHAAVMMTAENEEEGNA